MRKTYVLMMLLALLAAATTASAQGFGVYEHGTCAMGRAGTGVAAPCDDGSAIFFNPAGLAFQVGQVVSGGATIINPRGGFTEFGTGTVSNLNVNYYPVPAVYYAKSMGKWAIGGGLYAPYGLTTDWPLSFQGRFLGYKTSLKGIYVQPTVGYKINDKIGIGGGIDITYASLELNQRLDLSTVPITGTPYTFGMLGVPKYTDFANVKLSGSGYQVGFHLGFQAKVTSGFSLGARYLARQRYTVNDGVFNSQQIATPYKTPIPLGPIPAGTPIDALVRPQFATGGSLADNQTVSTAIVYPDQFVTGIAWKAATKTTMFLEYQFVNWSLFDKLVITRSNAASTPTVMNENYKDSHGGRFGVEYELDPKFVLRGGFLAHTAAAPYSTVTPLLPEGPRAEFTVGLGAKVAKNIRTDFAYQYLFQADRMGRSGQLPNNGTYNFMSHLFGVSAVLMF